VKTSAPVLLLALLATAPLPAYAQFSWQLEPAAATGGRYSSNITLSPQPVKGTLLTANPSIGLRLRRSETELYLLYAPQATLPTAFVQARQFGVQHNVRAQLENRFTSRTALTANGVFQQALFGESPDALGLAPNQSFGGSGTLTYELAERVGVQGILGYNRILYRTSPYTDLSQTTLKASELLILRLALKTSTFLQVDEMRMTYPTRPQASALQGFLGYDSQVTAKLSLRARAGAGYRAQGNQAALMPMGDVTVREDFTPMTRVTLVAGRKLEDSSSALYAIDDHATVEASWYVHRSLAIIPSGRLDLLSYRGSPDRDFAYRAGLSLRAHLGSDLMIDLSGGYTKRASPAPTRTYQEQNIGLSLAWYPSGH
jgi:hypothetical protein